MLVEDTEKYYFNTVMNGGEEGRRSVFCTIFFSLLMQFYKARTRVIGKYWRINKIYKRKIFFSTGYNQLVAVNVAEGQSVKYYGEVEKKLNILRSAVTVTMG